MPVPLSSVPKRQRELFKDCVRGLLELDDPDFEISISAMADTLNLIKEMAGVGSVT